MDLFAASGFSDASTWDLVWLVVVGWTPPLVLGGVIGFWLGRKASKRHKQGGDSKKKDWLDQELDKYYKEKQE